MNQLDFPSINYASSQVIYGGLPTKTVVPIDLLIPGDRTELFENLFNYPLNVDYLQENQQASWAQLTGSMSDQLTTIATDLQEMQQAGTTTATNYGAYHVI